MSILVAVEFQVESFICYMLGNVTIANNSTGMNWTRDLFDRDYSLIIPQNQQGVFTIIYITISKYELNPQVKNYL